MKERSVMALFFLASILARSPAGANEAPPCLAVDPGPGAAA